MEVKLRNALALAALGVSSVAFAGTYSAPACVAHPVTVPCESSAWDIGFEVFWAEATSNEQGFAVVYDDSNAKYDHYSVAKVTPEYEFGFELEASYHFSTGMDLTIAWESIDGTAHHILLDNSDTTIYDFTFFLNTPTGMSTQQGAPDKHVSGWVDYDFDAVNVELGQHIDVGENTDLRVHAGVQYVELEYIKKTLFQLADNAPSAGTYDITITSKSEFDGFGARMGADLAYAMGDGFSLVAHGALSMIVGDIDHTTFFDNCDPAASDDVVFEACSDSNVIFGSMMKLGLNYSATRWDANLSVEGGWRFEGYNDVINLFPFVPASYENFTFHGPYLAVKFVS